jgi:hypothetical protein
LTNIELRTCLAWIAAAVTVLSPFPASAQGESASQVLSFLVTTQLAPPVDFTRDQEAAAATHDTLVRSLVVELANVPVTTSSSGFSYRFNPVLGTFERLAQGFGPFFVSRAMTAGKGRASFSATYRHSEFTTLDGRSLRDGTLVTNSNKFSDEPAPFDVESLKLQIQTSTVTVFGTFGLTDNIDIGVAVPVVRLQLSGERTNTYRGVSLLQARGRADYVGVADVPIRLKFQFDRVSGVDLASDFELRLPTGDPENLNGSGRYSVSAAMVASTGRGPIEAHANGGFTLGGASNQLSGTAAIAGTVLDRVTVSAETLVRRIARLRNIRDVAEPHPGIRGVETSRLLPGGQSGLIVTAVAGVRWNVTRAWLVTSYALFPSSCARDSGAVDRLFLRVVIGHCDCTE